MFSYVAFDVETTGTSPQVDSIIEIGAVRFVQAKPVESLNLLIDPGRPIPPEATKVHGITNSMVKGQYTLEEALEQFTDFCGANLMVAHNAPFDVKFLTRGALREQIPLPEERILDTLPMAKQVLPDLFNFKLETLVRQFGIKQGTFHRATQDAEFCGLVFLGLLRQLKKNGGKLRFENILNLTGPDLRFPKIEPKAKQVALFG